MGLNIKNPKVEALASEVAELAGETKTEAVGKAFEERRAALTSAHATSRDRKSEMVRFLEREAWPKVPPTLLDRGLSKREREKILGYGPRGV